MRSRPAVLTDSTPSWSHPLSLHDALPISYYDNGIKFFSAEGTKLPDQLEFEIERLVDAPMQVVEASQLGKVARQEDASGRYIEFCKSSVPTSTSFKGLKIVLDCAHGATYKVAPAVRSEEHTSELQS